METRQLYDNEQKFVRRIRPCNLCLPRARNKNILFGTTIVIKQALRHAYH